MLVVLVFLNSVLYNMNLLISSKGDNTLLLLILFVNELNEVFTFCKILILDDCHKLICTHKDLYRFVICKLA